MRINNGFTLVVMILLLNVLDIYNTLHIIELGGSEENPIMDYFLKLGVEWFIIAKMSLSTFGLLTIYYFYDTLISINNKYRYILLYILILYIILIIYQYYLLYFIIGIYD